MSDKLTFGELLNHTPFVTADGCTWRKVAPKANQLRPNAPQNNAMTLWRRNAQGDAYYGHFADDFSAFILASAYVGECEQIA